MATDANNGNLPIANGVTWSVFGSETGVFGAIEVDAATGKWAYTLDHTKPATDALQAGDRQDEKFTLVATWTDANGDEQTQAHDVTVSVDGANDVSTVTLVGADPTASVDLQVTEAGGVNNADDPNSAASGQLQIADADNTAPTIKEAGSTVEGTYGDLTINADNTWSYSLRNDDAAVEKLKDGQQAVESLTLHLSDNTTYTLTINITGKDDAANILEVDTFKDDLNDVLGNTDNPADIKADYNVVEATGAKNSINGTDTASGKLKIEDLDSPAATLKFKAMTETAVIPADPADPASVDHVAPGSSKGIYGDFTLNTATGEWSYALRNNDANVQALTSADTPTEIFTVYTTDGISKTITVKIQGADDITTAITQAANADTRVDEADADASPLVSTAGGTLLATGDQAGNTIGFVEVKQSAKYGSFTLDKDTGAWTYTLADPATLATTGKANVNALITGQVVTETMLVKSSDGGASLNVAVTIYGEDDKALLSEPLADAKGNAIVQDRTVTEKGGTNNGTDTDSVAKGHLVVVDPDAGQAVWNAPVTTTLNGQYGKFTFTAATGDWTYTLDQTKADPLKAGEVVYDYLKLTSKDTTVFDASPQTDAEKNDPTFVPDSTKGLFVTITGANDQATINGTSAGKVTEDGGKANAVKGISTASGSLTVKDIDGTGENMEATFDDSFQLISGQGTGTKAPTAGELTTTSNVGYDHDAGGKLLTTVTGTYGKFTLTTNDAGNVMNWSYKLDNADVDTQHLQQGQQAIDKLMVYSADGATSQALTVSITGSNDLMTITSTPGMVSDTQAGGYDKNKAAVTEILTADGTLAATDPDTDQSSTFKAADIKGTYGVFHVAADGAWTYDLHPEYVATRALTATSAKTFDQATVSTIDNTTFTIKVGVTGADNGVDITSPAVVANSSGTITYTAADGDAGTKLSLMVGGVAYSAATVNDGKASTLVVPLSPNKTAIQGMLSVSDGVLQHNGIATVAEAGMAADTGALGIYWGMGTAGNDTLLSTADAAKGAVLAGYGGADVLTGSANGDRLAGGSGHDVLTGNAGADMFVFAKADIYATATTTPTQLAALNANSDVINDWDWLSGDKIVLDKLDLGAASLTTTKYIADGSWLHVADATGKYAGLTTKAAVLFDPATGNLFLDSDGTGKAAPVLIAVVNDAMGHAPGMGAGDFLFI